MRWREGLSDLINVRSFFISCCVGNIFVVQRALEKKMEKNV